MIERKDIFIDGAWTPSEASDRHGLTCKQHRPGETLMKRRTFLKAVGLTLALPPTRALAQVGSGRTIRMVVPLPAGTSNDAATRIISAALPPLLGQSIVVDNRAGGAGLIGTMEIVRAKPDGLTLMCASLSPLAANVAFVKNLPYDPRRDLTHIAGATLTNHVLVVAPSSPIRTFADFIGYAKQRPGQVTIGYSTAIVQLQIATLNKLAGIELMPVPYRGAPASVTDVMAGVLTATMANPGPVIQQEKSGQLRPLAVTSLKRNPITPDWPAVSETLPGFDFPSWNAFVGPAGLPPEQVNRLSAAIAQAQKQEDVVQKLANEATLPLLMGPDELKAYIEAEVAKYVQLAEESGIQAE
ncbi:MAG: tripartite tricarboxylate transporter substrate binding protein [Hyphomicrobiaceae bacterium]